MADGYEDRLRQGRELRQLRRQRAHPDSPCARCSRDFCPSVCFPRRDWEKRKGGRQVAGATEGGRDGK